MHTARLLINVNVVGNSNNYVITSFKVYAVKLSIRIFILSLIILKQLSIKQEGSILTSLIISGISV